MCYKDIKIKNNSSGVQQHQGRKVVKTVNNAGQKEIWKWKLKYITKVSNDSSPLKWRTGNKKMSSDDNEVRQYRIYAYVYSNFIHGLIASNPSS